MHYRRDTAFKAYKLGHLYFLVSTSEADPLSASDKQYWVSLVDNSLKGQENAYFDSNPESPPPKIILSRSFLLIKR